MMLGVLLLALGCTTAQSSASANLDGSNGVAADAEKKKPPTLLGVVTREQIAQAEPEWVTAEIESEIDPMAAAGLADVPGGAELTVYFGTWCGDSKRELSRFFRALDETAGMANFDLELIAVDRREGRPKEILEDLSVYWVPTFILRRDGEEVGRIVESSPHGIETDLLALLSGEAEGLLTDREDGAVLPVVEKEEGHDPAATRSADEVLDTPSEGQSGEPVGG